MMVGVGKGAIVSGAFDKVAVGLFVNTRMIKNFFERVGHLARFAIRAAERDLELVLVIAP